MAQTLLPEGEDGIVARFQMGMHPLGLPGVHYKGQFQQKCGGYGQWVLVCGRLQPGASRIPFLLCMALWV
ncbi:hypothetical protein KSX_90090 [Ktedonospora formicarum]|uniref:Uncharacterized protein n=1 Tax=Ktedonospora formicarum TaxID=2778364 RepID=A0A8J3MYC9_9CHLR|nr:hypothetical protein KSX_90090 [Ktedonospora formicarum]